MGVERSAGLPVSMSLMVLLGMSSALAFIPDQVRGNNSHLVTTSSQDLQNEFVYPYPSQKYKAYVWDVIGNGRYYAPIDFASGLAPISAKRESKQLTMRVDRKFYPFRNEFDQDKALAYLISVDNPALLITDNSILERLVDRIHSGEDWLSGLDQIITTSQAMSNGQFTYLYFQFNQLPLEDSYWMFRMRRGLFEPGYIEQDNAGVQLEILMRFTESVARY